MIRWAEIGITIAGAILVAYLTMSGDIQSTKMKVEQLEKSIIDQRQEYKEIRAILLDIQIKTARDQK